VIELRENWWAVEVPEGAKNIETLPGSPQALSYEYYKESGERCDQRMLSIEDLPPGTWQIICTLKDASYTQAAEIVESEGDGFKDHDKDNFHHDLPLMSPFDSLRSLLTAKGCDLNKNWLILKKG
jgi:hypothetical protein